MCCSTRTTSSRSSSKSTRIIDIEKFVPRDGIDRLYWDTPYHLMPSGKTGVEAFAVIREAMKKKGMVAIGRLVMSTRERICAIEIEESGLLLTTLRTAEEVRDVTRDAGHATAASPTRRCSPSPRRSSSSRPATFDPADFVDRYEDALRALIEQKKKGRPVRPVAVANDDTKVVDLMAALKRSLKGGGDTPGPARRTAALPVPPLTVAETQRAASGLTGRKSAAAPSFGRTRRPPWGPEEPHAHS